MRIFEVNHLTLKAPLGWTFSKLLLFTSFNTKNSPGNCIKSDNQNISGSNKMIRLANESTIIEITVCFHMIKTVFKITRNATLESLPDSRF